MRKLSILILLTSISFSAFSQKRNIIKLGGLSYDNWTMADHLADEELGAARFGYTCGYERLIGERLAVSLTYNKIIHLDDNRVTQYYTNYSPATIQGYRFNDGYYSAKGYFIGYESKYYFDEFDEDGANSFYLGFNYLHGKIREELNSATYEGNNSASNIKEVEFQPHDFSVNRIGLKLGVTYTSIVTSDLSFTAYLNSQPEANKQWLTPAPVNGLSFNLSWVVGFAF